MRKLKLTLIAATLLMPILTYAEAFPWLTFRMTDDIELSVAAENLTINYKDGNLILSSSVVDKTIPANQIKSMRFSSTPAGINEVIDFKSSAGDYYNLSGLKVGNFASIEAARNVLPSGIYIVKNDQKTFKVTL
ncbi:MAG: hypothetical protein K2L22_04100 [Muribaculaceae bacterium]|nr:hypothetical protein [Muribaculaceae bacterium]